MRDATHMQSVERWARFIKEHPAEWKKEHTAFINAQFVKHHAFVQRLKQQPGGNKKIKRLYATL